MYNADWCGNSYFHFQSLKRARNGSTLIKTNCQKLMQSFMAGLVPIQIFTKQGLHLNIYRLALIGIKITLHLSFQAIESVY